MFVCFPVPFKQIHHYLTVYQVLLKEHLPLLFNHLQELGLNAEVYLIDWMLTVFSKALPLDLASRVWDAYLYFGDHFLYRCALGILKYYQEKLLSLQFGEAAELLTHIPRDLDDDDLFYMISTIPLNKTRFEELVQADNLDLFCAPALSAAANKSSSSLGV